MPSPPHILKEAPTHRIPQSKSLCSVAAEALGNKLKSFLHHEKDSQKVTKNFGYSVYEAAPPKQGGNTGNYVLGAPGSFYVSAQP